MKPVSFQSVTATDTAERAAPSTASTLTSGRVLAGNTLWNFLGLCAPAVVAILCLPVLKHQLGTDRLGVLSLAWVVVGYFGLFDFGLSRALTKLVAEKMGNGARDEIPSIVWIGLAMMAAIGIAGTIITYALSPWLVSRVVKLPPALRGESLEAFYWLSISIPIVVLTAGLRGILEALQAFRLATVIRIPLGMFTYLGPVLVLPFSQSIVAVVAVLVIGRFVGLVAHAWGCVLAMPSLRNRTAINFSCLKPLLHFGTWMTVSNIVNPFMVAFDRFVVGALLSVAAVAYYAVPSEVVMRFTWITTALVGVLFPAFSTVSVADRSRLIFLYQCGIRYIFLAIFPVSLMLIAFAPEGLRIWLGADFARNSTPIVRWLAAAIFINGLAQIPFAHIQGAGRPDITAKLHLLELPVYAAALFFFTSRMGIEGVAITWTLRVAVDTVLLFVFSHRLLPDNGIVTSKLPLFVATALIAFLVAGTSGSLLFRVSFVCVTSGLLSVLAWFRVLSTKEKQSLLMLFQRSHVQG